MNPVPLSAADSEAAWLAPLLAEPTLPQPSPELWSRIERSHRRRRQRRRLLRGGLVASLLLGLLAGGEWLRPPSPSSLADHAEALPPQGVDPIRLRALDRQLQASYEHPYDDPLRQRLWRDRQALLSHPTPESADETPRILSL